MTGSRPVPVVLVRVDDEKQRHMWEGYSLLFISIYYQISATWEISRMHYSTVSKNTYKETLTGATQTEYGKIPSVVSDGHKSAE